MIMALYLPSISHYRNNKMKKGLVIIWLTSLVIAIAALFWYNEWKYSLPTPVPKNYNAVTAGADINLPVALSPVSSKPTFLHFFNPNCPCSRFNMEHFKSLVKQYGNEVNFVIVTMTSKDYTEKDIQEKFNINIPVSFDSTIAASCGIYSTPQAVILNADHKLYFRGNYNKSRYCSDKKSEYARIALEGLLKDSPVAAFNGLALKAYGCELPACNKK
jgi:thiol-disulfide isomerase/thioredoxin